MQKKGWDLVDLVDQVTTGQQVGTQLFVALSATMLRYNMFSVYSVYCIACQECYSIIASLFAHVLTRKIEARVDKWMDGWIDNLVPLRFNIP